MRNNVETRRCGCGVILGLREGCQRCADVARAKLHAQGVAWFELKQPEEAVWPAIVPPLTTPQDIGEMAADEAIEEARKMGLSGHEADVYINRRAREAYDEAAQDEARTQREQAGMMSIPESRGKVVKVDPYHHEDVVYDEDRNALGTVTTHIPAIGGECGWVAARAHMEACGEARYTIVGSVTTFAMRGGELSFLSKEGLWKRAYTKLDIMRWVRLPDAATVPEIGAEVSWETAKADMQARPEARYLHAVDERYTQHRFDSGLDLYWKDGEWRRSQERWYWKRMD